MNPLLYVEEEYGNVERALKETLRYDYSPGKTVEFYNECKFRLHRIREELDALRSEPDAGTSRIVSQLWDLSNRLTFIERSHLGEFSWPFAQEIERIALRLLSEEEDLRSRIEPIIHMIAEGTSYQILSEEVLGENKRKRMYTVAFPRQLKHHVLMHALFGHELGHATFYSTTRPGGGSSIDKVVRALRQKSELRNAASVHQWMSRADAPERVRAKAAPGKLISETNLEHWHVELVCDLFGLLIFGPSFAAAHRAYLEPSCRSVHEIEIERTSHPSYALRRTLLAQAQRLLSWDKPVTRRSGPVRRAETALITYAAGDDFGDWPKVFHDDQVKEALQLIRDHFEATGSHVARPPDPVVLATLYDRIARHLPPIGERIEASGLPTSFGVRLEEQLYAAWAFWLSRNDPATREDLSFLQLNQLCDMAFLQQQAIDLAAGRRQL